MFDIITGKPPKCPECGQPLKSETEIPDGLVNKSVWDGIYQAVFLTRRPRFVCMNKNCGSYYMKTRRRFLRSLAPGVIVSEHFLDEATRNKGKKKK